MARQSVRCKLCKTRFMTELSDMETAINHESVCEKYAAQLARRVAYMTRAVSSCIESWKKDPARIMDGERYQMRCAYLTFDHVRGTHNPGVPCDSRCTGARGNNCECSCGGKNHGAANAINGGMAAVSRA